MLEKFVKFQQIEMKVNKIQKTDGITVKYEKITETSQNCKNLLELRKQWKKSLNLKNFNLEISCEHHIF